MFRRVERRTKTGRQFCRPPDVRPGVRARRSSVGRPIVLPIIAGDPARRPDPEPANPLRPHLVGRRPLAAATQAVRIRPRDPAFTVLRRLDCVLAPTKAAVLAEHRDKEQAGLLYLVVESSPTSAPPQARRQRAHGPGLRGADPRGKPQPDSELRDTENVRCPRTCRPGSSARCCPAPPTPGSTTTRPGSAMRSFNRHLLSSSRRGRWRRSTPT